MSLPRMSVSSQNEVLPGMKAHRAAHAAAAHSDRLSSGSRRHSASFSVPSQPAVRDAPPTRIASSPRFSLHSDRVADPDPYYHVVEAMSQASMPQHHRDSLHRRSSQSSRYSSATAPLYYPEADSQPAATHAGSHYHVTEPMLQPMLPPRHSSSMQRLSRHSSRFSDSNSNPQVPASSAMPQQPASGRPFTSSHRQSSQSSRSAQQPQVSSAQSISHHAPPWGISQDQSQAKLAALSDLYQSSSPPRNQAPSPPQRPKSLSSHLPQQRQSKQPQPQQRQQQQRQQQQVLTTVPASQPLLPAVSAAYMSGFQNGFQTGFQHGSLPVLQQYSAASGRSSFALEAPNLFLEDSSSGELDGYTMMDTTFEQAQAWQSSLLEVTEVPPSEQGDEARSVASFEPEPAVHAAPAVAQRAEGAAFQTSQAAASPRAQHAVHAFEHAVVPELSSAGMVPPEHQSGTSPHDWLKLPDEAQEEEHQQAPSTPDSPYAIDNWLSSQQADCLASGRQLSGEWTGFENRHAVHAAASSTPSITPASSFENTSGQFLQAHRQQQPEEASVAVNSKQVPLPSDILYDRLQQLNQLPVSSQASQPHATATASEAQQPSEPQQSLTPQERSQQQQGVAQQPASASPFAHWSSTPILGPSNQSGRVTSTAGPAGMFQQAQQVFELRRQPQHAQRPPSLDWPAQHAQQAEQAQRSTTAAADPQVRRITSPSTTPTQSDSPSVVQQGFDIPFTNTSSPRQTAAATQHVQTRPSESWQASSLQEPGDTSHVDSSLLLTFAPVGSGDLSVPNRQSPAHGLSPSSSRELADSPGTFLLLYTPHFLPCSSIAANSFVL